MVRNYNYIVYIIADGFNWSMEGFGVPRLSDSGLYAIQDKGKSTGTASSHGYTAEGAFPSEITDVCPNAPDCTHAEAVELVETSWWSG